MRRRLVAEPLEARRVLAASVGWDGPGLGSAELTYTIRNAPSSLSQTEVNAAIETAFNAWASVADITFTEVSQTGLRDSIDISFTNIDGVGGTLAQAYFPDDVNPARIAGDIQFDLSEVWEVGNSRGNRAFDLVWVAVHEIGHSLGLDHLGVVGSVLQAYVSPNQSFSGLSTGDIKEIQGLYAAAAGSVAPQTPVGQTPANDPADPTDTGDTGNDPIPRTWSPRGGFWWNWVAYRGRRGGRLDAGVPANHNLYDPTDANGDGSTSALDALVVINQLTQNIGSSSGFCDVNADRAVSSLDALMVINSLTESAAFPSRPVAVVQQGDALEEEAAEDGVVDDEDGTIIEDDEVSSRCWEKISPADSSDDGGVSWEELEIWLDQRTTRTTETTVPIPATRGFDLAFAQLGRRFGHGRR
jgi:hypothetical protein